MRDDLKLAAYAVACGFTLGTSKASHSFGPDIFDARGIPHDGLQFERKGIHVWDTSRGWRVAAMAGDRFEPLAPNQFHSDLHKALTTAIARGDAAATIEIEDYGYRVRTYEGFMHGAVEMTGFAGATAMTADEQRARHDEAREALRARAADLEGSHVVYDPSGDGEGWLLVGSEAEIRAETVEMIQSSYSR